MLELLLDILQVLKWMFWDVFLSLSKVSLGVIGEFKEIIGIVIGIPLFVAGVIKLIRIKTR